MRRDNVVEVGIVDVQAMFSAAHRALIAYQDAERAEQAATVRAEQTREEAAQRRLELGRELIRARKAFPRSGPKAAGWGKFLADLGVSQQTAFNHMKLAGFVEEVSQTPSTVCETQPAHVPTYAEAGIKKAPTPVTRPPEPASEERREATSCQVLHLGKPAIEVVESPDSAAEEIAAAAENARRTAIAAFNAMTRLRSLLEQHGAALGITRGSTGIQTNILAAFTSIRDAVELLEGKA